MRLALSLILVITGCATRPSAMRPAAGACRACTQDAVVVFVRPAHEDPITVEIREEDGTFLGRLENRNWFSVPVAPGRHLFVGSALKNKQSRPSGLIASLEGGKVYYVEIRVAIGYPHLFAASPMRRHWDELVAKQARTTRVERDPAVAEPETPATWPASVGWVKAWWTGLPPTAWTERTLMPEDGVYPEAGLIEPAAPGVACAAKPLELFAAMGDPSRDPGVPVCWRTVPAGSHLPVTVCKTKRELDEVYEQTQLFLKQFELNSPFKGN